MNNKTFTYGLLDQRLRAIGFTARTQKGKTRIYTHDRTGARIILPDAAFDEQVLPHHLVVARRVLKEHNLGDFVDRTKTYSQYPVGAENLQVLKDDLIREYKKEHPDEAEELDVSPPIWYANHDKPEDGLLKIGRSIFVIRNNKVEDEIRETEKPAAYWL